MQFLMNHGTPKESKIANEFAPKELDTPIPLSPEDVRNDYLAEAEMYSRAYPFLKK